MACGERHGLNAGSLPPWALGYAVCASALGSLLLPAIGTGCSALRAGAGALCVCHGRGCTSLRWMQLSTEVHAGADGGTRRWVLVLGFKILLHSDSSGRHTRVSLVLHIT